MKNEKDKIMIDPELIKSYLNTYLNVGGSIRNEEDVHSLVSWLEVITLFSKSDHITKEMIKVFSKNMVKPKPKLPPEEQLDRMNKHQEHRINILDSIKMRLDYINSNTDSEIIKRTTGEINQIIELNEMITLGQAKNIAMQALLIMDAIKCSAILAINKAFENK